MPPQTAPPTILVMTAQAGEAERLISTLRQGGLAAQGKHLAPAAIDEAPLERGSSDLIIFCSYDAGVSLDRVLRQQRALQEDVPLIVIADHDSDRSEMIQALRAGARDVIERDDTEHLRFVVARELGDLRQRRGARRLMQRLQQYEERQRALTEATSDPIAFVQEGIHVFANPAYLALFGYSSLDDLQAAPFLDLIGSAQRRDVRDLLRTAGIAAGADSASLNVTCARADATRFEASLLATRSEMDGEPCLRISVRPAAAPVAADESIGTTDKMAHLPGLNALMRELRDRIGEDRVARKPFAMFFIRPKGAASLLANLGLWRGLSTLAAFGATLSGMIEDRGFLAQVSDEGFGLIVDGLDEPGAETLTKSIRAQARMPLPGKPKTTEDPQCDVGYIVLSGRTPDPVDALDAAFRKATQGSISPDRQATGMQKPTSLASRNKQVAEDGDEAMATRIEEAIARDRLMLVYQPIVSLLGDNQENYSVLVRLLDEHESLLEAKDFIGPSIRLGLIERIDKWAIRQAIRIIGDKRRAGHNLSFFINLAEDTFRNPGVIIWICDCLREFDVRGNWLTFLFQEELVLGNLASLSKLVEGLKKIKCRVAVNRFGGSNRPEMLLQGLPLDYVLLLPEFAQGLADDKDKQRRLLLHTNLAREFNVKSVVTGVEDARALTILWTAGVDYVQGNFLQRPSPTLELQS